MLQTLLIRDWKLHKDALLLLGVTVLLMVPVSFAIPQDEPSMLPAMGRIAFGLGCLLPFLAHARELMQGTLGDVLALPIARRDLVKLRWAEALLFGTLFFLIVTLPSLHRLSVRELAASHFSCTLPWIFLGLFAAQLPFQLRFGQKGGFSFAVSIVLMEGWAFGNLPAEEVAKESAMFQEVVHFLQAPQRAWALLGAAAPYAEILLVGLMIGAAYRFAILAMERCDA